MIRPKVLVLLAAYNGSAWIVEQLQSILDQVGVDVHVVISDDRSSDDTSAQVGRFASDARVRTVSPPSATGSAAGNFFWLMAQTSADGYSVVSFADQDDVWHADKLSRACDSLESHSADGYSCAVIATWANGRRAIMRPADRLTASDFLFESAGQGCTYVITEVFYRRLRTFLLDNRMATAPVHYHDWAIYALSRAWRLHWKFDPQPTMQYRQHDQNDTGARVSIEGVKKRMNLIKSGWYLHQVSAIAQLCHIAAPSDGAATKWCEIMAQPRGAMRRWRMARFCMQGGRRRRLDQAILLAALIVGIF